MSNRIFNPEFLESWKEVAPSDWRRITAELIGLFKEAAPRHMKHLGQIIAGGDQADIERTAHILKSSFGNIGAERATRICEKIELSCRRNENKDLRQPFKELEEAYRATLEVLKDYESDDAALTTPAALTSSR